MGDTADQPTAEDPGEGIAVGTSVRVYPGTGDERHGTVVEDYGEMAGQAVEVGGDHIVDAARRWAVSLDDGTLVFVDSENIAAD
jgi:hypothetical protein